jgi:CHAT domain-containing protein/tetratricopeptide (TPR) repeat protein
MVRRVILVAWLASAIAASAQTSSPNLAALRADVEQLTANRDWTALIGALDRWRTALAAAGDRLGEAEALRRLGLTHQQLKAYAAARESFTQAHAIVAAAGQYAAAGQLLDDLGFLSWTLSDWPGVREHYGAAANAYETARLPERQANSLRNMSFARDISINDRLPLIERAIAITGDSTDRRLRGLLQHMLGDLQCARSDYDPCLDALESAVTLLADAPRELSLALTSLGRTYRIHGQTDRALATYGQALQIQEKLGDRYAIAQTHDAIGVALFDAHRSQEAVVAYARAVEIARHDGSRSLPSYLTNYALALQDIGDFQSALNVLRPALSAPLAEDDEARMHSTLSRIYRGLGQLDLALVEAEAGVTKTSSSVAREEFFFMALEARALVHLGRGDRAAALADVLRALSQIESLRARAVPRDAMKAAFTERHRALFALAIMLQRDSGDAAAAFETAERGRARAFADLLASRHLERDRRRDDASQLPSMVATPAASLDTLQPVLKAAQTTLLAYWVEPDETTIWIVPPAGKVTAVKVAIKASRYEALTQQVWQVGASPSAPGLQLAARSGTRLTLVGNPRRALRELYDALIKPVEASLPNRNGSLLTIVPHGPLFGVPFAALTDTRQRYLIETYRLHHVASAALLQPPGAASGSANVLLVGDPAPLPAVEGARLAALPGARVEVRDITAALPKGSAATLIGSQATESRVRSMTSRRAALHFATHGIVFNERPFDSFLALAPDPDGSDGRFTTADIYTMRLETDLVVLSACRTATGQLSGDGVQGLARAFFYAGTPSVIATLWDFPDGPARHLFPEFYRSWRSGADRSTALRTAQLSLIRALRRGAISVDTPLGAVKVPEHPAVWAAPVLLGQP